MLFLLFLFIFIINIKCKEQAPNILFIIVDDLGYYNFGYKGNTEVQTPYIDSLVLNEGLNLNRHYVHMMCTPSRASFQSGRLPVHILTQLAGKIYK